MRPEDAVGSLWLERELAGRELLPVRGTTARPLPAHVREAVLDALDRHDVTPPSRGLPELRAAIGRLVGRDPETEVLVTNGAQHALTVCFRALLEPGDGVLIPTPAYFFGGLVERAGGSPVYVPSDPEDGWRWDPDLLAGAIGPRTRVLVLCNPCNPTGYVPSREVIDALVAVADTRGLTIVTDEAYERYLFDGAELASVPGAILVRSIGKSYALPSWRLGFLAGPPAFIERCVVELEWDTLRCPYVGQRAALAAIEGPQGWLEGLAREYERNRDIAFAAAQAAVLPCLLPRATPFLFVEAEASELQGLGIPAVDGRYFGAPGYARVPFGGDAEALASALSSLASST